MAPTRKAGPIKSKPAPSKPLSRQSSILSYLGGLLGSARRSSGSTTPLNLNSSPASFRTAPTSATDYASDEPDGKIETPSRPPRGSIDAPDELKEEPEPAPAPQMAGPDMDTQPPVRRYRQSTQAPDNFKEQIQILFEEDIYDLAIQSLQTNLFSQSYLSADTPLWVAPPTHIAFLGTLVIHPLYTTRAREDGKNKKMISVRAHQYLLDVLRSVGPINGHFRAAFAFRDRSPLPDPSAYRDRSARANRRRRQSPDDEDTSADDYLTTPLANDDSLWQRVPDFWTMLGWAFSCAVSHPERWVSWKLWLELLLEVLERDLKDRIALDEDRNYNGYRMVNDSIIRSYIGDHQLHHIMRVLFAYIDGDSHHYQQIWPKETKGNKVTMGTKEIKEIKEIETRETRSPTATNKRKRGVKVDLENDEYGDWSGSEDESIGQEDEDEDEDVDGADIAPIARKTTGKGKGASKKKKKKKKKRPLPLVESPLLEETIPIRRRIFALISELCYKLPEDDAPFELYSLYEGFASYIRDLSLDVFPHFICSRIIGVESIYVTLIRHLLQYLLPPGVPQPGDVDKETNANGFVSAVMMEKCFLPFASKSVVADNAKLAAVLYELFSFMWHDPLSGVKYDTLPELKDSILAGLEAREKKSRMKREVVDVSMIDSDWCAKTMEIIQKDPHAPANVLRDAHMQFRLVLRKWEDAELALQAGKDNLEADFLGFK